MPAESFRRVKTYAHAAAAGRLHTWADQQGVCLHHMVGVKLAPNPITAVVDRWQVMLRKMSGAHVRVADTEALGRAANGAPGLGPFSAWARELFRRRCMRSCSSGRRCAQHAGSKGRRWRHGLQYSVFLLSSRASQDCGQLGGSALWASRVCEARPCTVAVHAVQIATARTPPALKRDRGQRAQCTVQSINSNAQVVRHLHLDHALWPPHPAAADAARIIPAWYVRVSAGTARRAARESAQ